MLKEHYLKHKKTKSINQDPLQIMKPEEKSQQSMHHRRSIRLEGYDYTQAGAYFITIVTFERAEIFGKIAGGEMVLNAVGEVARQEWWKLPGRFPALVLGE